MSVPISSLSRGTRPRQSGGDVRFDCSGAGKVLGSGADAGRVPTPAQPTAILAIAGSPLRRPGPPGSGGRWEGIGNGRAPRATALDGHRGTLDRPACTTG